MPPRAYQGDAVATKVTFTKDPSSYCVSEGLDPSAAYNTQACAIISQSRKELVVPNPCLSSGNYAKILCHEIGHINGWPANHSRSTK